MKVQHQDYREIPRNKHGVSAGSLLLPTETKITGTGTSLDFVKQQGGDTDTLIFLFGLRQARSPLGFSAEFLEGIFLTDEGPGFRPTWGFEQLMREIDLGGWRVIPTPEVLLSWCERIERRMNK